MTETLTPMMVQYKLQKEKYKDAILLFRLGDFYEMFFEDALESSKILGITLTSRTKGAGVKVPMCGVPFHAVDNYIAKLTRAGKKVAICDQVTAPNGKGIVEREVVRVVTPGTTFDDNILDGKTNNFIAAVTKGYDGYGLAYSDLTTGDFWTSEFRDFQGLENELVKIAPAEMIVVESLREDYRISHLHELVEGLAVFSFDTFKEPRKNISDNFGVKALQVFGLEDKDSAISASSLLYEYLKETQKTDLTHIEKIVLFSNADYMALSGGTIRNLGIFGSSSGRDRGASLVSVIDKTVTAMGGRKLKKFMLHPLSHKEQVEYRLEGVADFYENSMRLKELRDKLGAVLDIERIISRLNLGTANARDLVALKDSLKTIPGIKKTLEGMTSGFVIEALKELIEQKNLVELIEMAIAETPPAILRDGGMIADGYNIELDELRAISTEGKTFIAEMQKREIERTGISSLKIKYNKVFGYYIEISNANRDSAPENYIRKQTLVNAERYITPELKEYEEKVITSLDKIRELEFELYEEIRLKVCEYTLEIKKIADNIAKLDVIAGFAEVAIQNNYVRPEVVDEDVIEIRDGRHPIVESLSVVADFVPNDCVMGSGANFFNLITGPNMGGKSVYIKQVALICFMVHIGCFVPASTCRLGLLDQIFTRVGASDDMSSGESTFMVEMVEASRILHSATARSLVILDEVGRGTSTYDGLSIAWAICEYLHDTIGAKTLFATHYHELIALVEKLNGGKNFSVAVSEKPAASADGHSELVFLYKIKEEGTSKSYGIEVAKLAGLPKSVIMNARGVLSKLEKEGLGNGRGGRVSEDQIDMFRHAEEPSAEDGHEERDGREHKALDELKEIDIDRLTPMQALNKIHELKEKGLL